MAAAGTVVVNVEPHLDEDKWAEAKSTVTEFATLQTIRTWPRLVPTWITAVATTTCAILLATR